MAKVDVAYVKPVKHGRIGDDFEAHVKRGSVLPGVDYVVGIGTKVMASGRGVVISTSNVARQTRGKNIVVRHPDGRHTEYLHLSEILVKKGQRVKAGQRIALSGNTSSGNSTGPHLHFTMRHGAKFLDPVKVLKREKREERREEAVAEVVVDEVKVVAPKLETPPMPKPPVTE